MSGATALLGIQVGFFVRRPMKIARYWASKSTQFVDAKGLSVQLKRWGYSNDSMADAQMMAAAKLQKTVDWVRRYPHHSQNRQYASDYAHGMRREEFCDAQGQHTAAVTRNRYGALVLNTADLLIADIDRRHAGLFGFLGGLFRTRGTPRPRTLAAIEAYQQAHPQYQLRIYESFAGYRVMVVNQSLAPDDPQTQRLFAELDCDPLYIRLCQAQQSFRARLTPKPWRCRCPSAPNTYPRETLAAQRAFSQWLKEYETISQRHAVCRLIHGAQYEPLPAFKPLLALHDQYVLREGWPLA